MKIFFICIVFSIAVPVFAQEGSYTCSQVLLADSVDVQEYENAILYFMKTNTDSAMYLITQGLPKKGGAVLYAQFRSSGFYPFDAPAYLRALHQADSVLNQSLESDKIGLCNTLRHMYLKDQMYRQLLSEMAATPGFFADPENRQKHLLIAEKMNETDGNNCLLLDSLLQLHGKNLFNQCPCDINGVRALPLVIMHADQSPAFQCRVLTKYKNQIIRQFGPDMYAFTYDRCMLNQKKPLRYYAYNPTKIEVINLKKVNKERRRIGLDNLVVE